eukprot:6736240-Prymnesium_polylepis.1
MPKDEVAELVSEHKSKLFGTECVNEARGDAHDTRALCKPAGARIDAAAVEEEVWWRLAVVGVESEGATSSLKTCKHVGTLTSSEEQAISTEQKLLVVLDDKGEDMALNRQHGIVADQQRQSIGGVDEALQRNFLCNAISVRGSSITMSAALWERRAGIEADRSQPFVSPVGVALLRLSEVERFLSTRCRSSMDSCLSVLCGVLCAPI